MREFRWAKPDPSDSTSARVGKKVVFFLSVGRNAIVVIICTMIAYFANDEAFIITGKIESGFPAVGPPEFSLTCDSSNVTETYDFGEVASMISSGIFIVPVIAVLENIAIASAFAQGKAVDATQVSKLREKIFAYNLLLNY